MKKEKVMQYLANSAIAVIVVVSLLIFLASFFPAARLHNIIFYTEINRFVQRIMSVILLVVAWNLYMRKRLAWIICIIALSGRLFLHFMLHHNTLNLVAIFFEAFALLSLAISHSSFRRPSDKLSVKRAALVVASGLAVVLVGAAVGRFHLSLHMGDRLSFGDSIMDTIGVIFGVGVTIPAYDGFILYFVWLCVAAGIILLLHSAIVSKTRTEDEKAIARELVIKYGQNCSSYLVLEDDKTLFFGKEVPGVIAYGVVGNVVTVCGDPVCAPKDFLRLLSEFRGFCSDCSYQCIFLGTTDAFLSQYEMLGYNHVKAGEEARFLLNEYGLQGGKMQKLRALINHANKEVTTHEYTPRQEKSDDIEKEIDAISEAWLGGKKSGKLGFTVGGVGLEAPMDRRYFYAKDQSGKIVAFNVFLPYDNFNGYLADVTRRIPHSPGGVTEKLTYDGFMTFKGEGAQWGSMGLAPLANVSQEGIKDDMTVKLLEFVYEKCNGFYGFKDLHHAKEKYSPTQWAPGYFVYSTKVLTPEIIYAVVKIQNPGGIKDFFVSSFTSRFKNQSKPLP